MNNIIEELARIEDIAKAITAEIETKHNELPARIKKRCEEIDAQIEAELKARIEEYTEKCDQETNAQIYEIQHETQSAFSSIESYYYTNSNELANELFRKVIEHTEDLIT